MTRNPEAVFLDAVVRVEKLHPPGRDVVINSDAIGLTKLADILKITAVERFTSSATVAPFRGGVRVLGQLTARIVQPSVVTFKPVRQDIDEPIDRVFMPPTGKSRHPAPPGTEIFVDLEDDAPDELDGPDLDLTDLLIETIALAIDPYPRAPGESLDTLGIKINDEEPSPFASLKSLKNPSDKS